MDSQKRYPPNGLAWSVWGMGALLYVTGFYQRVAPAVMTTELMQDFQIGAQALGNLSAFYYYSLRGHAITHRPFGRLVGTQEAPDVWSDGGCLGNLHFCSR